MTRGRADKQALFKSLTQNVYFQAPPNTLMQYPCIRYEIDTEARQFADNAAYLQQWGYQVIVIDEDPDSALRDAVASLPRCRFVRKYVADDLHHFVFNLF